MSEFHSFQSLYFSFQHPSKPCPLLPLSSQLPNSHLFPTSYLPLPQFPTSSSLPNPYLPSQLPTSPILTPNLPSPPNSLPLPSQLPNFPNFPPLLSPTLPTTNSLLPYPSHTPYSLLPASPPLLKTQISILHFR